VRAPEAMRRSAFLMAWPWSSGQSRREGRQGEAVMSTESYRKTIGGLTLHVDPLLATERATLVLHLACQTTLDVGGRDELGTRASLRWLDPLDQHLRLTKVLWRAAGG
jgi:hypothetical protein